MEKENEMVVKRLSVPLGLEELMESLTKEVLRKKPDDIYTFASDHFAQLLTIRDRSNYGNSLRRRIGKSLSQTSNISMEGGYQRKSEALKIKSATTCTVARINKGVGVKSPAPKPFLSKRNITARIDTNLSPRTIQNNNTNTTLKKSDKTKMILEKRKNKTISLGGTPRRGSIRQPIELESKKITEIRRGSIKKDVQKQPLTSSRRPDEKAIARTRTISKGSSKTDSIELKSNRKAVPKSKPSPRGVDKIEINDGLLISKISTAVGDPTSLKDKELLVEGIQFKEGDVIDAAIEASSNHINPKEAGTIPEEDQKDETSKNEENLSDELIQDVGEDDITNVKEPPKMMSLDKAATLIQSLIRSFLVRKKLGKTTEKPTNEIQANKEDYHGLIQFLDNEHLHYQSERYDEHPMIPNTQYLDVKTIDLPNITSPFGSDVSPSHLVSEALSDKPNYMEEAATTIQSAWRGHRTRRGVKQFEDFQKPTECDELPHQRFSEEDAQKAATVIQALFRGYLTRKSHRAIAKYKPSFEETLPTLLEVDESKSKRESFSDLAEVTNQLDEDQVNRLLQKLEDVPQEDPFDHEKTLTRNNTVEEIPCVQKSVTPLIGDTDLRDAVDDSLSLTDEASSAMTSLEGHLKDDISDIKDDVKKLKETLEEGVQNVDELALDINQEVHTGIEDLAKSINEDVKKLEKTLSEDLIGKPILDHEESARPVSKDSTTSNDSFKTVIFNDNVVEIPLEDIDKALGDLPSNEVDENQLKDVKQQSNDIVSDVLDKAATKIQHFFKDIAVKKKSISVESVKTPLETSTEVMDDDHAEESESVVADLADQAATTIQKTYKGYRVRRDLKDKSKDTLEQSKDAQDQSKDALDQSKDALDQTKDVLDQRKDALDQIKDKEVEVDKEITRYLQKITEPIRRAFSADKPYEDNKASTVLRERSQSAKAESPEYIYIPLRQYTVEEKMEEAHEVNNQEEGSAAKLEDQEFSNEGKEVVLKPIEETISTNLTEQLSVPSLKIEPDQELKIDHQNKDFQMMPPQSEGHGSKQISEYIDSIVNPIKLTFSPNKLAEILDVPSNKGPTLDKVEPEYEYIPLRDYSVEDASGIAVADDKKEPSASESEEDVSRTIKSGIEDFEKAVTATKNEVTNTLEVPIQNLASPPDFFRDDRSHKVRRRSFTKQGTVSEVAEAIQKPEEPEMKDEAKDGALTGAIDTSHLATGENMIRNDSIPQTNHSEGNLDQLKPIEEATVQSYPKEQDDHKNQNNTDGMGQDEVYVAKNKDNVKQTTEEKHEDRQDKVDIETKEENVNTESHRNEDVTPKEHPEESSQESNKPENDEEHGNLKQTVSRDGTVSDTNQRVEELESGRSFVDARISPNTNINEGKSSESLAISENTDTKKAHDAATKNDDKVGEIKEKEVDPSGDDREVINNPENGTLQNISEISSNAFEDGTVVAVQKEIDDISDKKKSEIVDDGSNVEIKVTTKILSPPENVPKDITSTINDLDETSDQKNQNKPERSNYEIKGTESGETKQENKELLFPGNGGGSHSDVDQEKRDMVIEEEDIDGNKKESHEDNDARVIPKEEEIPNTVISTINKSDNKSDDGNQNNRDLSVCEITDSDYPATKQDQNQKTTRAKRDIGIEDSIPNENETETNIDTVDNKIEPHENSNIKSYMSTIKELDEKSEDNIKNEQSHHQIKDINNAALIEETNKCLLSGNEKTDDVVPDNLNIEMKNVDEASDQTTSIETVASKDDDKTVGNDNIKENTVQINTLPNVGPEKPSVLSSDLEKLRDIYEETDQEIQNVTDGEASETLEISENDDTKNDNEVSQQNDDKHQHAQQLESKTLSVDAGTASNTNINEGKSSESVVISENIDTRKENEVSHHHDDTNQHFQQLGSETLSGDAETMPNTKFNEGKSSESPAVSENSDAKKENEISQQNDDTNQQVQQLESKTLSGDAETMLNTSINEGKSSESAAVSENIDAQKDNEISQTNDDTNQHVLQLENKTLYVDAETMLNTNINEQKSLESLAVSDNIDAKKDNEISQKNDNTNQQVQQLESKTLSGDAETMSNIKNDDTNQHVQQLENNTLSGDAATMSNTIINEGKSSENVVLTENKVSQQNDDINQQDQQLGNKASSGDAETMSNTNINAGKSSESPAVSENIDTNKENEVSQQNDDTNQQVQPLASKTLSVDAPTMSHTNITEEKLLENFAITENIDTRKENETSQQNDDTNQQVQQLGSRILSVGAEIMSNTSVNEGKSSENLVVTENIDTKKENEVSQKNDDTTQQVQQLESKTLSVDVETVSNTNINEGKSSENLVVTETIDRKKETEVSQQNDDTNQQVQQLESKTLSVDAETISNINIKEGKSSENLASTENIDTKKENEVSQQNNDTNQQVQQLESQKLSVDAETTSNTIINEGKSSENLVVTENIDTKKEKEVSPQNDDTNQQVQQLQSKTLSVDAETVSNTNIKKEGKSSENLASTENIDTKKENEVSQQNVDTNQQVWHLESKTLSLDAETMSNANINEGKSSENLVVAENIDTKKEDEVSQQNGDTDQQVEQLESKTLSVDAETVWNTNINEGKSSGNLVVTENIDTKKENEVSQQNDETNQQVQQLESITLSGDAETVWNTNINEGKSSGNLVVTENIDTKKENEVSQQNDDTNQQVQQLESITLSGDAETISNTNIKEGKSSQNLASTENIDTKEENKVSQQNDDTNEQVQQLESKTLSFDAETISNTNIKEGKSSQNLASTENIDTKKENKVSQKNDDTKEQVQQLESKTLSGDAETISNTNINEGKSSGNLVVTENIDTNKENEVSQQNDDTNQQVQQLESKTLSVDAETISNTNINEGKSSENLVDTENIDTKKENDVPQQNNDTTHQVQQSESKTLSVDAETVSSTNINEEKSSENLVDTENIDTKKENEVSQQNNDTNQHVQQSESKILSVDAETTSNTIINEGKSLESLAISENVDTKKENQLSQQHDEKVNVDRTKNNEIDLSYDNDKKISYLQNVSHQNKSETSSNTLEDTTVIDGKKEVDAITDAQKSVSVETKQKNTELSFPGNEGNHEESQDKSKDEHAQENLSNNITSSSKELNDNTDNDNKHKPDITNGERTEIAASKTENSEIVLPANVPQDKIDIESQDDTIDQHDRIIKPHHQNTDENITSLLENVSETMISTGKNLNDGNEENNKNREDITNWEIKSTEPSKASSHLLELGGTGQENYKETKDNLDNKINHLATLDLQNSKEKVDKEQQNITDSSAENIAHLVNNIKDDLIKTVDEENRNVGVDDTVMKEDDESTERNAEGVIRKEANDSKKIGTKQNSNEVNSATKADGVQVIAKDNIKEDSTTKEQIKPLKQEHNKTPFADNDKNDDAVRQDKVDIETKEEDANTESHRNEDVTPKEHPEESSQESNKSENGEEHGNLKKTVSRHGTVSDTNQRVEELESGASSVDAGISPNTNINEGKSSESLAISENADTKKEDDAATKEDDKAIVGEITEKEVDASGDDREVINNPENVTHQNIGDITSNVLEDGAVVAVQKEIDDISDTKTSEIVDDGSNVEIQVTTKILSLPENVPKDITSTINDLDETSDQENQNKPDRSNYKIKGTESEETKQVNKELLFSENGGGSHSDVDQEKRDMIIKEEDIDSNRTEDSHEGNLSKERDLKEILEDTRQESNNTNQVQLDRSNGRINDIESVEQKQENNVTLLPGHDKNDDEIHRGKRDVGIKEEHDDSDRTNEHGQRNNVDINRQESSESSQITPIQENIPKDIISTAKGTESIASKQENNKAVFPGNDETNHKMGQDKIDVEIKEDNIGKPDISEDVQNPPPSKHGSDKESTAFQQEEFEIPSSDKETSSNHVNKKENHEKNNDTDVPDDQQDKILDIPSDHANQDSKLHDGATKPTSKQNSNDKTDAREIGMSSSDDKKESTIGISDEKNIGNKMHTEKISEAIDDSKLGDIGDNTMVKAHDEESIAKSSNEKVMSNKDTIEPNTIPSTKEEEQLSDNTSLSHSQDKEKTNGTDILDGQREEVEKSIRTTSGPQSINVIRTQEYQLKPTGNKDINDMEFHQNKDVYKSIGDNGVRMNNFSAQNHNNQNGIVSGLGDTNTPYPVVNGLQQHTKHIGNNIQENIEEKGGSGTRNIKNKSEPFYLHQENLPHKIPATSQERAFSEILKLSFDNEKLTEERAASKKKEIYDSIPVKGNLGSSRSSMDEPKQLTQHVSEGIQCNLQPENIRPGSTVLVQASTNDQDTIVPVAVQMNQVPAGAALVTSSPGSSETNVDALDYSAASVDSATPPTQAHSGASETENTQRALADDSNEKFECAGSDVAMETAKRNNSTIVKKTMEQEAATKIQASFRGYQVRKQLKNKLAGDNITSIKRTSRRKSLGRIMDNNKNTSNKDASPLEEVSATKIQAGVRGFLVRRRQQKTKSTPESP